MSSQSITITDKRKDLLAAALQLFVQNGFHGTPTSKIAKQAGVANGTLFHYFNTKEDLIVSLYIDIKNRMGEYIEARVPASNKDPKKKFSVQFTELILWSLEHKDDFYFLQQFHASPFAALLSPEEVQRLLSKSCAEIDEAIKQKAIKSRDVHFILSVMMGHINGLNQYLTKANLSSKEQKAIIKDSFKMLWKMIS